MPKLTQDVGRRIVRELPFAALLGGAIGVTVWMFDRDVPFVSLLATCVWIGLCIYFSIFALLFVFWERLERLRGVRQKLALTPLFFVGGGGGFFLGAMSSAWLGGGIGIGLTAWSGMLAMAGALAVVLGIATFSYELLKARLSESLQRIQEQEVAEKELETAREIQSRLLPPAVMEMPGCRIAARNEPARYVAGDFYDVIRLGGGAAGELGLVVADVAGKGVGASLVMASVKTALTLLAPDLSVTETMSALNARLVVELPGRKFVALCLARLDPATGAFEIANAGMPDPYLLSPGSAPCSLKAPGPRFPLGIRQGLEYETFTGSLAPGEALLLLSDGLPEALTGTGEPLGYERFEEALVLNESAPEAWLEDLFSTLENRTGSEREDDWTALLALRGPASGRRDVQRP